MTDRINDGQWVLREWGMHEAKTPAEIPPYQIGFGIPFDSWQNGLDYLNALPREYRKSRFFKLRKELSL